MGGFNPPQIPHQHFIDECLHLFNIVDHRLWRVEPLIEKGSENIGPVTRIFYVRTEGLKGSVSTSYGNFHEPIADSL